MERILHHFKKIYLVLLLFAFSANVKAQCSITGITPTASGYNPNPCASLSSCGGILYVGDGVNPTNLIMNTALNLTCLGSIQLIIRNNASIDFSSGNDYLTLAAGSSILFEGTGTLVGGSCNASERIYIGGELIASCNGNAGADYSFPQLISQGGYNIVNASINPTAVCGSGSFSITATAIPSSGATIKWFTVPSGGSSISTGNTYTTPVISASTTYYVEVYYSSSGFTTPRKAVVATVNPLPNKPTVAITQPTCTLSTGTITITGVAGETYSFDNGAYSSTLVYSGLVQGSSHTVYAKNSSGCISLVTNSTINTLVTNTYSAGVWSAGSAPTSGTQNIVFNSGFTATTDLSGCSCTVNSGNVIINSGKTLTITNNVTVNAPGTLTFEDSASLVQINNVSNTNSGNIKYKRLTTAIRNTDYTYWSSPVAGFTLGGVSPNTLADKFYSFDSTIEDWKQESAATSMVVGVGYLIRGPQLSTYMPPFPPNLYQATFLGVPNNGHYEITGVVANKSYLLGNPYPSALDADTFLDDNSSVLDGTLYFWTHNTPIAIGTPNPGSGLYAYSGDDYASYNRTGGTATAAAPSASTGGLNINIPSGKIASGQGFFGSSKVSITGSTIVFNNSMRVGVGSITGSNDQFYRTKDSKNKTTAQLEKHRIWLDLTNSQGAFKQTLIGYITGATNDYEGRFDGESYDGNDFLDFYSILQDKNLAIQGRALPFDENDEIPLGYRVAIGGTFTIKIGQTDGLLLNKEVFIEDQLTHIVSDLKSGSYTFSTEAGTFDNRFVLRYRDKTLSVDQPEANDGIIVLYSNNYKTLIIKNNLKDTTVNSVTLFNMSGQKITDWDVKESEQTTIQIPIKNVSPEIYIVKVKTTKGETGKKIVIK